MEILKRVENNKLRMVYYLIVYTVLLVQFPKKNCWPPPINKTWIRHCLHKLIYSACAVRPINIYQTSSWQDDTRTHQSWVLNSIDFFLQ